jgi:transaldolase
MRAGGVQNYEAFGTWCVGMFPNHSLSFEVVADDIDEMYKQAHQIASWGPNICVKIPITTTDGTSTVDLIDELSHGDVRVNVTAVFTNYQAREAIDALDGGFDYSIVSVFAGRIADTGVYPEKIIQPILRYAQHFPTVRVLWASAREVFNVTQANSIGCDIITLSPDLIAKLSFKGKDLDEFSLDTVKMFRDDALAAGLSL